MDQFDANSADEWRTRLYEAVYGFSMSLKDLDLTNPWPDNPVLAQAMNTLGTELWDRSFGLTEVISAFKAAAADLPRYAAGQEHRL